ncbi:MAG: T9SS type A sorting domain-containing protein, partial [bacterium]|nr:T9SS type A sorting domain-containing protein [Candidatus Kapabacteria bacterium]
RRDLPVNDFRIRMLTPGVTLNNATVPLPAGWLRTRISADSVQFFTTSRPIRFGQFVEGFRFEALNVADTFRVLYSTYNSGDFLCSDTATLVCSPLDAIDSLRVRSAPNCCSDLTLKNAHQPGSSLDRFVLRVLTPGARISTAPVAPTGWTRAGLPAAGDSVLYTRTTPMTTGDTAAFNGLCFDNANAATDTLRYSWTTFSGNVPVTRGTQMQICLRPLTRCDTARITVDSTEGATSRCLSLFVTNRNSRDETITRVVARIANPGTPRRILTATAPGGWQVSQISSDSVVFTGGEIEAGDARRFDFCLSLGDSTMRDPVTVTWRTSGAVSGLCSGTININANIIRSSDAVDVSEIASQNPEYCCYSIAFLNRNDKGRTLTGFQLEVVTTDVLFGDATGSGPWNVVSSGFPAPQIGFSGGSVAPGDSTPRMSFCIDARNIPGRPATIPIIWRSYSDTTLVTSERLSLRCVGQVVEQCDSAQLLSTVANEFKCTYSFGISNLHSPPSSITKVQFVLTSAVGEFDNARASGDASRWTQISVRRDSVVFRGDSIASRATVGTFSIDVDQNEGVPTTFEVTTYNGDESICRDVITGSCGPASITIPTVPTGFRLGDATPNPLTDRTSIAYELLRPSQVVLLLRDESGQLIRRMDFGQTGVGLHTVAIDASTLPSGLYLYTLEAGGERWTKRLVVVR